ncbi:hypothetical protein [Streptomyces sp. AC555_RSS877]|uniref:hypothetical protein n=1 Tax=Streptomyces sp. AC555_RSS877 TaxID=2823688 RepID=UPI001C259089|nr:hypothetical protein [Streptomyces sp. AC555_RSS877]
MYSGFGGPEPESVEAEGGDRAVRTGLEDGIRPGRMGGAPGQEGSRHLVRIGSGEGCRGQGPALGVAGDGDRRPLHRELMAQAPSVLGTQYRHINDTVAQPQIERLLTALDERGELQPDVPVPTAARLLLAGLCEGNQIIAAAADREDALNRTFHTITLLMSGLAADGISARSD